MAKVKRRNAKKGLNISFDVGILNAFIKYALCDMIPKTQLNKLYQLFQKVDAESYAVNPDIHDRVLIIKNMMKGIIEENITDMDILSNYILQRNPDISPTFNNVPYARNQLSESDINALSKMINERMQSIYIYEVKDGIIADLELLDSVACASYVETMNSLKAKLSELLSVLQMDDSTRNMLTAFDFSGPNYRDYIDWIVSRAHKPSSVLQTGIRQLNAILSPGFQGGRMYCFLGCTGKFKSGTLINLTDQMRLFNPQVKAVENGKRKTILFITLENSIHETVERLVDMYNDENTTISDMSTEEVIAILRDKGNFVFTETEGIDIEIRYYGNLEINAMDIHKLILDMSEQGKQVIALVLDYIARLNSVRDTFGDERRRIIAAASECKSLIAYPFDIPVITAMQINREGNAVLDAAMREDKEDLAQLIGASAVGLAWGLNEEVDWLGFIYPERQKSTGKLFLSFKRFKIRGAKDALAFDYFNHPFTNLKEIRLQTDVDKPTSVSIISLKDDMQNEDKIYNLEEEKRKRNKLSSTQSATNTPQRGLQALDLSRIREIVA